MKNTKAKAKAPKAKTSGTSSLLSAARHILTHLGEEERAKLVKAFTPKAPVAQKAQPKKASKAPVAKAKKASAPVKAKAKKSVKAKSTKTANRKLSRTTPAQGETVAA